MTDQPGPPPDRTADLERRIGELERETRRARGTQSRSGMEEAFWALMHTVFPDEARRHLRSAGREQLLAARVYLDRWIAGLEEGARSEASPDDASRTHERIEVE
jgi:hypothetical protein